MSQPQTRFDQYAATVKGLVNQASTMSTDAAQRAAAGDYTVDDRIGTLHKFFDLALKTYVAMLQLLIASPSTGKAPVKPLPSEEICVTARDYPRKCTIAERFRRVGLPSVTVPSECIIFLPADVIEANAKKFQIALSDYHYTGANYEGIVRLTPTTTSAGAPSEDIRVTVGL